MTDREQIERQLRKLWMPMPGRDEIERELAEELKILPDYASAQFKKVWDALLSREIALRELRTEENYALDSRDEWKARAEADETALREARQRIIELRHDIMETDRVMGAALHKSQKKSEQVRELLRRLYEDSRWPAIAADEPFRYELLSQVQKYLKEAVLSP